LPLASKNPAFVAFSLTLILENERINQPKQMENTHDRLEKMGEAADKFRGKE